MPSRLRPVLEVVALVLLVAVAVVVYVSATGDDGGDAADSSDAAPEAEGPPPGWPAPPDPMALARAAGLEPEVREELAVHLHAQLDVFYNGDPVTVPAGIGIDITDPKVHTFDDAAGLSYGGIVEDCDDPCISPLHTHDETGIVHTESNTMTDLSTLGQFFTEWDVRLDGDCVGEYCSPETDIAVYVDGDRFDGNPADIRLADQLEIAIVIGSPPDEIPTDADFSQA